MTSKINAITTGSGGIEVTGDSSGEIELQADGSTIATITSSGLSLTGTLPVTDGGTGSSTASGARTALGLEIGTDVQAHDADTAKYNDTTANFTGTLQTGGNQVATQNALGVRNLIINGDMRIDQRNSGSAVTVNANSVFFPVDRFHAVGVASAGVFTAQQVSDSPDGSDKSLKFTVTTTASSGAYRFHHNVEGNHIAHLGFGQSWAKTFTLSFWVKSSVTGTYSGSFRNSAHDRSYVFEYTINTADTWERKTITVTADTTGTWLTDNGSGLKIIWSLGSISTTTAGSWQSGNYFASTNQTEWIATSGATFYISQVQLEVGDTATPFEHRPYDMELLRCYRYFQKISQYILNSYATTGATGRPHRVTMRSAPTAYWSENGTAYQVYRISDGARSGSLTGSSAPTNIYHLYYIYNPVSAWACASGSHNAVLTDMELSAEL